MEGWELCWSRVAFSDLVIFSQSFVARVVTITHVVTIILLTDDYFWKRDHDTYTTHFTLPPAKQTLLPLC